MIYQLHSSPTIKKSALYKKYQVTRLDLKYTYIMELNAELKGTKINDQKITRTTSCLNLNKKDQIKKI